jgi:UDP-N-acetylmuramyl pentapeptide phosphotransferase/UDP-N-acetylglucosamine-1-phosphate transferase
MSGTDHPMLAMLGFALLAFGLAGAFVRFLLNEPLRSLVVDKPNERSLHAVPVPRIGGAGLLAAAFLLWASFATVLTLPILLIALVLAAVCLADDVMGLSPGVRRTAQLAGGVSAALLHPAEPAVLIPVVILTLVWMANLYNFMDGSDGLAGGMAVFGFGAYALAAAAAGAHEIAFASAVLSGAAGGFLLWNFPKAKIFMGDVGSVPLGLLAGALGYLGWSEGLWPFFFPPLAFLPFIADATVTLVRRARRGERLSSAHRSHYYQRLNRMGLGHRRTALLAYALMAATGLSALFSLLLPTWLGIVLVALWLAALMRLMAQVDRDWVEFVLRQEDENAMGLTRP